MSTAALPLASPGAARKLTFDADDGFHAELKRRVREALRVGGQPAFGGLRMHLKTATILSWLVASYTLLVFSDATWWQASLLAASLALAVAAGGFAIHPAPNPRPYSGTPAPNTPLGVSVDS